MRILQEALETIIEKLCRVYFNKYDLLIECHYIDGEFITLYNDYIIEEEE